MTEKLERIEWDIQTRLTAARILGQLHSISVSELSSEFKGLTKKSRPNRDRIRNGVVMSNKHLTEKFPEWRVDYPQIFQETREITENAEPRSSMEALVHGDYFSKNIIPTRDGIYIIDWDLLALGDPMWDLGFLIGTDPDVEHDEAEAVIAEYRRYCQIDEKVLSWHRKCWRAFWELIKITKILES